MPIADFTNAQGKQVEIDKLNNGKYCITVGGRMTQKDLSADGVIGWFANASNCHVPETLTVELGKSYYTANGRIVKITEKISEEEEPLACAAGYAFRSESGRNYTAYGDNNDSDLCLVREAKIA